MYGIDKSTNFDFLVGKDLIQICIGLYKVTMNFSNQITIAAECVIHLHNPDETSFEIFCDNPVLTKVLTCLLGRTIESVNNESKDEINMIFSDNFKMSIFDSNKSYESFTVTTPDFEIIV